MTLVYFLLGLLPSFVQRPLRNLMGARIESGAKVSILSFVAVRDLRMGRGARIGPFVVVKARSFVMEPNAVIRPCSLFKVREVRLGRDARFDPFVLVNCDYGPRSKLEVGRFSRVFSFSVLEPSEGIHIGDQTGLGGHSLVFCHGSWPNYLEGAPYSRGPVRLEDHVWIPWRVMILPNAEIGSGAVIGAHSLVRGRVPPRALYSGVPAKLVREDIWTVLDDVSAKEERLREALESFHVFHEDRYRDRLKLVPLSSLDDPRAKRPTPERETVFYSFEEVTPEQARRALATPGSTVLDLAGLRVLGNSPIGGLLVAHLATFGVRLSAYRLDEL